MAKSTSETGREAVVKTSGRAVITIGLTMLILLFVVGGAWAYFANLSGAIIAQGQVAVLGKPKTIQHLDGGIVAEIGVDNGDRVAQGDVLIRLDDTLLKANKNIYQHRLQEVLAQQARLITERNETDEIEWDDDILKLFDLEIDSSIKTGQQELFEARRNTRHGQISQLKEKAKQFKNQIKGIKALKASKTVQKRFLNDELKGIKSLTRKKLFPKSQMRALQRQREQLIGEISGHDAELAQIRGSISETKIQILQIDREFRQTVLTELRQVEQDINDMTQQLQATLETLRRVDIKAPVSGIVHELSVFTIGGIITPGNPVLQIIPQNEGFEIEANVEPQFIDELHPDQLATLRFSAFNQRTTPELNGKVKDISPNVMVSEQTGQSFYKVRLTVPESELARLNDQPLVPGMPVEAFIKTRERTPLNYLTKPLLDQINRAFREE